MPNIPLLRDIFPSPDRRPPISVSLLAKELNVPVDRLIPLIEQGYLRSIDPQTVESPSPAGLLWLRSWFQPAMAKGLFSLRDIAQLLQIEENAVLSLLAAHDIPTLHDEAIGFTVSLWSARRMLLEVLGTGDRFDRQSLLWFLVGNPRNLCPEFSESLEREIERIANLPEPARSIRKESLLKQWADAKAVAGVTPPERIEKRFRSI